MRIIEQQMLAAIESKQGHWSKDNTMVSTMNQTMYKGIYQSRSEVYLHRNHIATYGHSDGIVHVNKYTLAKWPSNTTKSCLRALGVNVTTKKGIVYLDNKPLAEHEV